MATRRRRTSSASRTTSRRRTTRRRTTTSRYRTTRTRRRRTGTATTFGSVFGLLLVWVLLQAPWWVKILSVVLALVAVAGYVLLTRGGEEEADDDVGEDADAEQPAEPETAPPAEETRP